MTMQTEFEEDAVAQYERIIEHPDTDRQAFAVFLDKMIKNVGHIRA